MTALSTDAIRKRLHEADTKKRLVISPVLDEEEQLKQGQASIDLRLGFNFCLVTASLFGTIDEYQGGLPASKYLRDLYRREYVPFGSSIIIHPHQFLLA